MNLFFSFSRFIKFNNFTRVKKALGDVNIKLEEMKKENALMVNELRDLKSENEKLGENMTNFSKFSDQSSQIVELERDNRKLKSDLEYFKY
jgi:regulator of replication initiation timing